MFKLVVLSTLLAIAAAEPGLLYGGARLGYAVPAVAAVPAAYSHTSRTDIIHHPPAIATYAAAAPVAYAPAPVAYASAPFARAAIPAPYAYAAPALRYAHARLGYAAAPLAYA